MSDKFFVEVDENTSIGKAIAGNDAYRDNELIYKTESSFYGRTFENWDTNVSIKSDYNRSDYNLFRDREARPNTRRGILHAAQKAYDTNGVVKHVIDLMSDFGIKGVRISHPIPSVDRFFKTWWNKVGGIDRSERFLNMYYRLGVVATYRTYGKLQNSKVKEYKSVGAKRIPLGYTFLNPSTLHMATGSFAGFGNKEIYVLKLPQAFYDIMVNLSPKKKKEIMAEVISDLPEEIKTAIKNNNDSILLDNDKLRVFHYKKDDWQTWGKPITYCIFDDLETLEKLKLADRSALDGAISNVRLWNIGRLTDNPQTTIIPTKTMINKLKGILDNNLGGGTLDLVWGPELSFTESNTQVHKFLGDQKYKPTLDAIYDGLGIPIALRGDAGSGASNVVSLKTLIEQLNYGRYSLMKFWNEEIKLVQKAMGFSKPAVLEFDHMVFSDEAAEKQLLINLADRDLISRDTVQEKFGINSDVENSRIKREVKTRGEKMPEKASPFHNPEKLHEYKKTLLAGGTITPSELGIELEPRKSGEKSKMDIQLSYKQERSGNKNQVGRPPNVPETSKRQKKSGDDFRVSKSQELVDWCTLAQEEISKLITKAVLESTGTKNVRSLNSKQKESLERLKAHCLFNISPFSKIDDQTIHKAFSEKYNYDMVDDINQILSNDVTVEQKRNALIMLYFLNNNDF